MLHMKLPDIDRICPQESKFAMDVENKATGDSKLTYTNNDSTENVLQKQYQSFIRLG